MKKLSLLLIALFLTSSCFALEIDAPKRIKEIDTEINTLVQKYNQLQSLLKETEQLILARVGAKQELEQLVKPVKQLENKNEKDSTNNNS